MPIRKSDGGYRIGRGPVLHKSLAKVKQMYRAYLAKKHSARKK